MGLLRLDLSTDGDLADVNLLAVRHVQALYKIALRSLGHGEGEQRRYWVFIHHAARNEEARRAGRLARRLLEIGNYSTGGLVEGNVGNLRFCFSTSDWLLQS